MTDDLLIAAGLLDTPAIAAALVCALAQTPPLRRYVPAVAVGLASSHHDPGGWGRYLVRAALRERFAGEAS